MSMHPYEEQARFEEARAYEEWVARREEDGYTDNSEEVWSDELVAAGEAAAEDAAWRAGCG